MSNRKEYFIAAIPMMEQCKLDRPKKSGTVQKIYDAIFASSSSSSEDSDAENAENQKRTSSPNFEATLDALSDMDFKLKMGLKRETVEYLITQYSLSKFVPDAFGGGRSRVAPKKAVYMYIWFIRDDSVTFWQLAEMFVISTSSVWTTVKRVTDFVLSISNEYIRWPEGAYLHSNTEKFRLKKRIPDVIGAVDCMHIVIKCPKNQKEMYINREKAYSIVLQAVVDADKKFVDITCGEPGSLDDYTVLKRSKLYHDAERYYEEMFLNNYFLIGDAAYPSTQWLVPPFKESENLTESQRKFNEIHNSTRMVVEDAFGLLKIRFPRLANFTEAKDLMMITNIVVSACILHNICINFGDSCDVKVENEANEVDPFVLDDDEIEDANLDVALDRRQTLFNYLRQQNII
ncbi:putative nuclease HARBI1 [Anastrepha obliqua]|uniref:putative nuclease HARBI1 n=1 Tax=Anastrepha obliqua TaxID=95512 RepID=UPI002409DAD0|nr:putative nuclease HARBI1 [Anastrepha obliqua]